MKCFPVWSEKQVTVEFHPKEILLNNREACKEIRAIQGGEQTCDSPHTWEPATQLLQQDYKLMFDTVSVKPVQ